MRATPERASSFQHIAKLCRKSRSHSIPSQDSSIDFSSVSDSNHEDNHLGHMHFIDYPIIAQAKAVGIDATSKLGGSQWYGVAGQSADKCFDS